MIRQILTAFLLLIGTTSVTQTTAPLGGAYGSVQGVVLDGDGKPLPRAIVYGLPEEDMRKQLRTRTDDNGKFLLSRVPVGKVYLSAYKEAEGYPYNFFSFYIMPTGRVLTSSKVESPQTTTVLVQPENTTTGAIIQLGLRAAYLKVEVTDEEGKSLTGQAALDFRRPDVAEEGSYGTSAIYVNRDTGAIEPDKPLLVPPVPFRFTVEVKGYEKWNSQLISLKSGESLTVTVKLSKSQGD